MDSNNVYQDLDEKISILKNTKQNQEFLRNLKVVIDYHDQLDLATSEEKIFKNILPAIKSRYLRVYSDNFSLFETLDDEMISILIKENFEVAFQLTENLQEILYFINGHSPTNVCDVESVLKDIPSCVLLFADHLKTSSATYKDEFNTEISKVLEVIKHLYASFLHIVEFSVNIEEDREVSLLADALIFICGLPRVLHDIDPSSAISTWKCFGSVTSKYSTALESCIDLQVPINALCEDIYKLLETIPDNDTEAMQRDIKCISFLIRLLFKLADIFYQQLNVFALELIIFYVKISSIPLEYVKSKKISLEALDVLNSDVFKNLDVFLKHLVMGQSDFKNHVEKMAEYTETMAVFKEHSTGVLIFLSKILQMGAMSDSDWSVLTINSIETIFDTLPLCYVNTFLSYDNSKIYQELILNISAAILFQDVKFQSVEILLRSILQEDVFIALLGLEIYILVVSNLSPEECINVLINLLYAVNDLLCGFFTNRLEMIYLKILLQKIYNILPDTLRDEIIKLFSPDRYLQMWRFLGFNGLPAHQIELIINPVIENTSVYIQSVFDTCNEDVPLNIAEGLDLLCTVNYLNTNDPKFREITKFLDIFWASDFTSNEILENNVLKYFVLKITGITSHCIQNSSLDLQMVSSKLKTLSCKESYWIAVYKIVNTVLNSTFLQTTDINKQAVIAHMAGILALPIQHRNNPLLRETYLEMLKNLNDSQNNTLNMLLDSLNPNTAHHVFQYLEKSSQTNSVIIDLKHYNKMSFKHKCLTWKDRIKNTQPSQMKRAKMELPLLQPKVQNMVENSTFPPIDKNKKIIKKGVVKESNKDLNTASLHGTEDDSSAAEVIARLKGEVKCLINVCKTEKLTQKNVADLRILISQMSSLM